MPHIEDCVRVFQDVELQESRIDNLRLKAQLQSALMVMREPLWNAIMLLIEHHKAQGYGSVDVLQEHIDEVIVEDTFGELLGHKAEEKYIPMLLDLGYDVMQRVLGPDPLTVCWNHDWTEQKYMEVYPNITEGTTILHYAPRMN